MASKGWLFSVHQLGKDMSVNTRLVIDEDGFIWIRDGGSGLTWNRVKTNVNVLNIVEFRASDDDYTSFFVICNDNNGFSFVAEGEAGEIYYYENGEPSGRGTAFDHFSELPIET